MPGAPLAVGFFGKIPSTGDFVATGLPRGFIDRWDRWMSMELARRPGDEAYDAYGWRFRVRAGLFGELPASGVWRISADRVGRVFPFVIAGLGAPPPVNDPWFEAVDDISFQAVASGVPPERIAELIGRLAPPPGIDPDAAERITFWRDASSVVELEFASGQDLAERGLALMLQPAAEDEEA